MPQDPADQDRTQLYLITPSQFEPGEFSETLAAALDAVPVACLRLRALGEDADALARSADMLREIAHQRDVPLVVEKHLALAERLGLDGVHLTETGKPVRAAREALGPDGIVGVFAGASRHDGMVAGEAGADYVSFGPVADRGLGEDIAEPDLFAWWTEMISVPVVAEGALLDTSSAALDRIAGLAPVSDFIALGDDLWRSENPLERLKDVSAMLEG
ncbi:MAG: thiamine phosphate synthase [Pseudomonadota bacterium]